MYKWSTKLNFIYDESKNKIQMFIQRRLMFSVYYEGTFIGSFISNG